MYYDLGGPGIPGIEFITGLGGQIANTTGEGQSLLFQLYMY